MVLTCACGKCHYKDYNFNVCIICQKKNKNVPCADDCKYLKEKEEGE